MKKSIIFVLTLALTLLCLTSCSIFDVIFGSEKGLTYKAYENCAVFTFEDFDGKTTVELARTGLDEGTIYYQASIDDGALSVKYKDSGYINEPLLLVELTADEQMPTNGSGGYVEKSKIEISFEAHSLVSGEIIIAFIESALKAVHKDKYLHEHTYEWETTDEAHKRIYTCNCDYLGETYFEPHYDDDGDNYCDECGTEYGPYYGAPHTPVQKEYKEPTCKEEGYSIIGCTECDEIYRNDILPKVDCYFEKGFCIWCGAEEVENE